MRPHYLHSRLKIGAQSVAEVELRGRGANVLLLDDPNFARYQAGEDYRYFGGHFDGSPAVIRPPRGGEWNVVVDLGGRSGRVSANVSVRRAEPDETPDEEYRTDD